MTLQLKILIIVASIAVGFASGWQTNGKRWQARHDKAQLEQQAALAKAQAKQAEATTQVVTEYIDRVQVVRGKTQTIVKEVPIYVKADDPDLPGGFRLLHDASARGEPADSTKLADAPSVSAQDVAATVADNYGQCREQAEQLKGLQDWVQALEHFDF